MSAKGSHSEMRRELWVQESGPETGLVIVLIHGSLDRASGMALIARNIRNHRTLRYDRRGYAKAIGHPGPFTVAGNVDDVVALVDDRSAVLVGHSYGGNVALAAAVRLGDQVVGVSTYETPLSWLDWWPSGTAGAAAVAADASQAAEDFMVRLIGRNRWDALPESTKQQRRREGVALKGELTDLRRESPWSAGEVGCPVIAGCGSLGAQHHQRGARWIADQVPLGSVVTLQGASHSAPTSHPSAFVDHLVLPHLEGRSTFSVTS